MIIATGILAVVVAGGIQAYLFFSNQTVKEAKKMDQLSEFTTLTKDLISFTEGAGISTFYLNLPIKTTSCNAVEPCVKQLDGETFKTPDSLPANLSSNTCIQFYKDAKGAIESKEAYPGKPYEDKIWENKDLEITTQNLYATWTIKDETSPPFMMIKGRDSTIFLKQLRDLVQVGADTPGEHHNVNHSFYASDASPQLIKSFEHYPFIIYSTHYPAQYNIQEAEEIVSCFQNKIKCIQILKKINGSALSPFDWINDNKVANALKLNPGDFPGKVYAIKYKAINFADPYFKQIVDRQLLPGNCKSQWGDNKQEANGYFFPSKVLSVSSAATDTSSQIAHFPIKPLYLSKYATSRGINEGTAFVTMPIDIVTFRAEATNAPGVYQLVSQLWYPTGIKKKIKIHKLTSPFVITRKLGSQEIGIWYNPLKN
jgi:hypothetical protein